MERFKNGAIILELMDRTLAEKLVAELEKHPPLIPNTFPDRDYFVQLLASTDVPQSRRFYENVRENERRIDDPATDQFHILSIRRILRNDQAQNYRLPYTKSLYDTLMPALGFHDSDIWTRRLRTNDGMVRRMTTAATSQQPYSLLAKLETFDEISGKVRTRPLVVIPNAQDVDKITDWEIANSTRPTENSFYRLQRIARRYA